jgi:hypothetical protein
MALVFGGVFLAALGGLTFFVISQNRLQTLTSAQSEALALAEAGIEYYKWHLAHFPTDTQNGTGSTGPYTVSYADPENGTDGTFTLSVTGNESCGQLTSIDLSSKGVPADYPGTSRTVTARYARPSVGTYSYILNDSVWAGDDRVILGPYHSNGGVRMDGTANSPVTSSLATWTCTSDYGCSPTQNHANGVVGSGPNQNLWQYPVAQVDFSAIAADFGSLKTLAQAQGLYYARISSGTNKSNANYWKGYHLTFNANGTVTVKKVTGTTQLNVVPVNTADDSTDRALIATESTYETKTIPQNCGLIYVEDNVWVDGTIPSKITLVAANVVNANVAPNAYLKGDIQYGATDGSDALTLIAENDVLVAPNAPTNMTLDGIFIAQNGAFGRNLYLNSFGSNCNSTYEPKGTLTMLGTTVSNKRTGTKWLNGCSFSDAGYQTRIDSYDRNIASDPPPFTPVVSTDYELMNWRQK